MMLNSMCNMFAWQPNQYTEFGEYEQNRDSLASAIRYESHFFLIFHLKWFHVSYNTDFLFTSSWNWVLSRVIVMNSDDINHHISLTGILLAPKFICIHCLFICSNTYDLLNEKVFAFHFGDHFSYSRDQQKAERNAIIINSWDVFIKTIWPDEGDRKKWFHRFNHVQLITGQTMMSGYCNRSKQTQTAKLFPFEIKQNRPNKCDMVFC